MLRLLADGMSAKAAARELNIAPRTVERHIYHIRLKTRTSDRLHLIAHALDKGLVADLDTELETNIEV